jgi:hypothetical protein
MPFLNMSGVGDLEILVAGASQDEDDEIGVATRSFSGLMRSSRRGFKEKYRFTVGPVTRTTAQSIRTTARANGGLVAFTGDAITAGTYLVRVGPADYVKDASESNDFRQTVTISLAQE